MWILEKNDKRHGKLYYQGMLSYAPVSCLSKEQAKPIGTRQGALEIAAKYNKTLKRGNKWKAVQL